MSPPEREFHGVWAPRHLWCDPTIPGLQKLILLEIHSLNKDGQGCWAGNGHFAAMFGTNVRQVQREIARLAERGLVTAEYGTDPKVVGGKTRRLFVTSLTTQESPQPRPPCQDRHDPASRPPRPTVVNVTTAPGTSQARESHGETHGEYQQQQQTSRADVTPSSASSPGVLPDAAAAVVEKEPPDGAAAALLVAEGIPRERAQILAAGRTAPEVAALIAAGRADPHIRKLSGFLVWMLATSQPLPAPAAARLAREKKERADREYYAAPRFAPAPEWDPEEAAAWGEIKARLGAGLPSPLARRP